MGAGQSVMASYKYSIMSSHPPAEFTTIVIGSAEVPIMWRLLTMFSTFGDTISPTKKSFRFSRSTPYSRSVACLAYSRRPLASKGVNKRPSVLFLHLNAILDQRLHALIIRDQEDGSFSFHKFGHSILHHRLTVPSVELCEWLIEDH